MPFLAALLILAVIGAREVISSHTGGHHPLILAAELGGLVLAIRFGWLWIGDRFKREK